MLIIEWYIQFTHTNKSLHYPEDNVISLNFQYSSPCVQRRASFVGQVVGCNQHKIQNPCSDTKWHIILYCTIIFMMEKGKNHMKQRLGCMGNEAKSQVLDSEMLPVLYDLCGEECCYAVWWLFSQVLLALTLLLVKMWWTISCDTPISALAFFCLSQLIINTWFWWFAFWPVILMC